MKKKSKIIEFPNKILKHIKDKSEPDEYIPRSKRGPQAILYNGVSIDSMIMLPVKYSYETRYDEYFIITRAEDYRKTLDCSNYIKVPLKHPTAKDFWKYPQKDDTITELQAKNLQYYLMKYVFLHVNDEHKIMQSDTSEEFYKYLVSGNYLPMVQEIKLGNGDKMVFSDKKANKYGLIGEIDVNIMFHVFNIECVKNAHFEYVVTTLDANSNDGFRYFVPSKLDNNITYDDGETNVFIKLQKYLFREVNENELPSEYILQNNNKLKINKKSKSN